MPGQIKSVSFMGPYDAEAQAIERRRALAQALTQQSGQPLPTNRMAGRMAIPISPWEGAAQLAQGLSGAYQEKQAGEQQKALYGRVHQERSKALAEALRMAQGSPGQAQDTSGEGTGSFDMSGMSGPAVSGQQAPNPLGAYAHLAGTGDQFAMQAGGQMLGFQQRQQEGAENRAARLQERVMALDAAAQNAALSREERAERAREAEALRRELQQAQFAQQRSMAGLAASMRQPPPAQVIQTAQGPMVLGPNGQAQPIKDPSGAVVKPAAGRGGPMTATAQKELIETEEQLQGGQAAIDLFKQARAINDKAMGFTGAGVLASAGTLLPESVRPGTIDATQNLDNILQTAALPQLKAIFGGMPTEGERKILLDVQGSSSKPAAVRKDIFDRAEKAIQARLKFAQEKAKRLREGTYFSGEGLPSIAMPGSQGLPIPDDPPPGAVRPR